MSNRFRGSSVLVATNEGGTQTSYKLQFNANALVEFEDQSGITLGGIVEMFSDPKQMSMKFVRSLLWAGLKTDQPDITVEQAGEIISDAGVQETVKALQEAFSGATKAAKAKASPKGN